MTRRVTLAPNFCALLSLRNAHRIKSQMSVPFVIRVAPQFSGTRSWRSAISMQAGNPGLCVAKNDARPGQDVKYLRRTTRNVEENMCGLRHGGVSRSVIWRAGATLSNRCLDLQLSVPWESSVQPFCGLPLLSLGFFSGSFCSPQLPCVLFPPPPNLTPHYGSYYNLAVLLSVLFKGRAYKIAYDLQGAGVGLKGILQKHIKMVNGPKMTTVDQARDRTLSRDDWSCTTLQFKPVTDTVR